MPHPLTLFLSKIKKGRVGKITQKVIRSIGSKNLFTSLRLIHNCESSCPLQRNVKNSGGYGRFYIFEFFKKQVAL